MKYTYSLLFLLFCLAVSAQQNLDKPSFQIANKNNSNTKATIDLYKIITLEKDTTYVDTTLSIKSEYKYNYLRKDLFGLLPFSNEGHYYNTLNFGLKKYSVLPSFGFTAKHINYLEINDINYYSVATPLTEMFFKTVMEQGQNVDILVALNTSKRLNISVAYRGIRSLGKYINQLTSSGNFRFTTSYNTSNQRYYANFHFTGQDLSNGENGGITRIEDFEGEDTDFDNRARLQVYLRDAKTFMRGKRIFLDHSFRINKTNNQNNLYINHQFVYENKFFEYNQVTVPSSIDGTTDFFNRFGTSYLTARINDQVTYNSMYNKVGAIYENKTLGKFGFFIDDFRFNYFYDRVLILDSDFVPNKLSNTINSISGQYEYRKNNWRGKFVYANSISKIATRNLSANLEYKINDKNSLSFQYENISKVPNNNYALHQSSYVNYNWSNEFKNEKVNNITVNANLQWFKASAQVTSLNDHLYFADVSEVDNQQLVRPFQYSQTINYLSVQLSREFKFRNFGIDNTFLYQKVDQNDPILNLPEFTGRTTIYYGNKFFKKNLQVQTGFIINYFTKYNADDFNPILSEFFVQTNKQIGDFPTVDFFVNGRIRQTRIFIKAEHFNSSFTGNSFYSTPNMPYRDFIVRFGLVWNLFQ